MSQPADRAFITHLPDRLTDIPADSILSRTLFANDQVKAVLFTFAPGQELSDHTASTPAIIHLLQGEARLTLGGHVEDAGPGTWVHMPAHLSHALAAKTPVVMLLLLLR